MKRVLDVAAALAAGVVLFPVLLGAMLLVRFESPGPAIFRQTRVGRHEKPFTLYKLRTMRIGTGDLPSHEVAGSAVTPMGRFLRRTKIDELPQLWNVLSGDMSLVGPRPCLPSQTEVIEARRRLGVDALRPGITGVSQVAGIDMSVPERLATVDAAYLTQASLVADLRLLALTLSGAGRGDRVRQ